MPMSLYALNDRGINDALQRRWLVRDDVSLTLTPEMSAVVPINADEMWYALGWRRYMASTTVTAVAAVSAELQIRVPRNANIITVVEGVWFGTTAAEVVVAGFVGTTDLATVLGGQTRDTIQPPTKPGTAVVSVGTIAPFGTGNGGIYSMQSNYQPPIFPLFIRPSLNAGVALDGYQFNALTINQGYDVCIVYRERMLNDQENSL